MIGKEIYILKKPLLGWARGERIAYDPDWNEWARVKTGETFNYRGSIGDGEVAMLLSWLVDKVSFVERSNSSQPTPQGDKNV